MLNERFKAEKKESVSYPLLKNAVYQVELVDVNIERKPAYKKPEEIEEVLSFEFAILSGKDTEGNDARLRLLSKNFVPTYLYISSKNGKNNLYKIVEALIKRELTKEEEANGITGKTLNFLIGKQCQVLLEKVASKKDPNKFYSNIANFLEAEFELESLSTEEKAKIEEVKLKKDKKAESEDSGEVSQEHEMAENEEIRPENIPF